VDPRLSNDPNDEYNGVCIDTGAERIVIGLQQAKAYYRTFNDYSARNQTVMYTYLVRIGENLWEQSLFVSPLGIMHSSKLWLM
jgi:hypothetical protein